MNNFEYNEDYPIVELDQIDVDSYVDEIFAKHGPDKEDYPIFYGLVDRIKAEEVESFRQKISPILNPETLFGFSYTKPFGYSGDFFIIEKIYQYYVNPDKRYCKWDEFLHSAGAVIAVRNRKSLAIEIFEQLNEKAMGMRQDVLILGSGPVTETYEFFERNPDSPLIFEMLDLDKRAIAYAKSKNRKYLKAMTFHNANVIRFTPDKKFDLIWSAGLFDYFKSKHFVYLLKRYYEYLKDGGEMIIGNFNVENPSRRSMEILGDWFLYHRSPEELKGFALQAGIEESKIDVIQEPLGINLFLRVKK
jgi:SAM-dependent methyltransferase